MNRVTELKTANEQRNFCGSATHVVIFYGSSKCGHCKVMGPIYDELPQQYPNIKFAHVETSRVKVDNIDGVPVFVLYEEGEPVQKIVGARRDELMNLIESINNLYM